MSVIYKTIDLFSGIGGIRRGFELTDRCKNVLSVEIDKYARLVYEHLYKEKPYKDVRDDKFLHKVTHTDYDILLAGFPCQAFSIAGLKEGFSDTTRGTLFFEIAKILSLTKPRAFFLENVEGLLRHDKGRTLSIIGQTLDSLGYMVVGLDKELLANGEISFRAKKEHIVRTPYDFGIPQKRSRVFLLGFRKSDLKDDYIFKKLPTSSNLKLYTDLNYLLDTDVDANFYLSQKAFDSLKKHKERHKSNSNGFGYIVVNDAEHPIANTIMATGGSGRERNLIRQYKENLHTYKLKKSPLNDEYIRYMTPNEWGKLQGFVNYAFMQDGVDTFSLPSNISNTQRYKLFGNSVCIPVVEALAHYLIARLDEIYTKK